MQREDTSKARELAEESRKIAARALEDSQVMKAVALNSRKIAEATRYAFRAERSSLFGSSPSSQLPKSIPGTAQTADGFDPDRIGSFAMKTIAILTMLFIPGTAIAVGSPEALRHPMNYHLTDSTKDNIQHGLFLGRWS